MTTEDPRPFRRVGGRPASLSATRSAIDSAARSLVSWRGRAMGYVRAGHDTVERIDDALRELHTARAALAAEIREDEVTRAERVDQLLAQMEGRP